MSRLLGDSAYKAAREQTKQKLTPMKSAIITSVMKDVSNNASSQGKMKQVKTTSKKS